MTLTFSLACLSLLLMCSASGGESLSPDDVSVITASLHHFRNADLSWLELISEKDLPVTGRTDIVVAALTDTNTLSFVNDPTLDGAAKDLRHSLSPQIKKNLRDRNTQPVSVTEISKQSVHFSTASEAQLGGWFARTWFADDFPKARAYVIPWLPGYSKDKNSALLSFMFGPRHHATQAIYSLKRTDKGWKIEWHKFNYYL